MSLYPFPQNKLRLTYPAVNERRNRVHQGKGQHGGRCAIPNGKGGNRADVGWTRKDLQYLWYM
eukprot:SAG22_NODE_7363_length_747_cov_1.165123_1_plen_63_part_01